MVSGETETQRKKKQTNKIIESQIYLGLKDVPLKQVEEIVIAYEPVWAIGTGNTASPDQVQSVHAEIRRLVEKMFSTSCSDTTRILYGGSVKPDNINDFMKLPDIDGVLVGGASLDPEIFAQIVSFQI